jgi:predicted permease
VLGGRGFGATLKATGLGAASSSCSWAAIAIAKSVLQKGAGLEAAVAFRFGSTDRVFELCVVLLSIAYSRSERSSTTATSTSARKDETRPIARHVVCARRLSDRRPV